MPDDPAQQNEQVLATALSVPVPRIYINGFLIAQSHSDMLMVAQTNGAPAAILNMSFTTAKSLVAELSLTIARLEATTGQSIMTMQDVLSRQSHGSAV